MEYTFAGDDVARGAAADGAYMDGGVGRVEAGIFYTGIGLLFCHGDEEMDELAGTVDGVCAEMGLAGVPLEAGDGGFE